MRARTIDRKHVILRTPVAKLMPHIFPEVEQKPLLRVGQITRRVSRYFARKTEFPVSSAHLPVSVSSGNNKRETGNWKLETGNWKLETFIQPYVSPGSS